ncbi:MAG: hypothetical protein IJ131_00135, partial [Eggerthellaceae bacterium]|nr:hypothetical protein [Eggerthellaceae bacterium]
RNRKSTVVAGGAPANAAVSTGTQSADAGETSIDVSTASASDVVDSEGVAGAADAEGAVEGEE